MRDPPLSWYAPPQESRSLGALALVAGTLGSLAVGLSFLDTARYLRFACIVARWTYPSPGAYGNLPTFSLALGLLAFALVLALVFAGSRRHDTGWLAAAVASALVAILAAFFHTLNVLDHIAHPVPAGYSPHFTGADALMPLAITSVTAPTAVALTAATAPRSLPARLALIASALPLLASGLSIGLAASRVSSTSAFDLDVTGHMSELVRSMEDARWDVALAGVVALVLAPFLRGRRIAVVAALAWLLVGVGLFIVTRPLAADADDLSQAGRLSASSTSWRAPGAGDAVECGARVRVPVLDLEGLLLDGRRVASPADFARELVTFHRNWSIVHPRDPFPAELGIRHDPDWPLTVATTLPWLAAARAAGYEQALILDDVEEAWQTRSMGRLTRRTPCQRVLTLAYGELDPDLDLGVVLGPSGPSKLVVGPPPE